MKARRLNSDKGCTSALYFELLKPCPFPGWHSLSISLRKYFLMGNICLLPWRALCYQIISGNKKSSFHNGNCFLYFLYIYFCTLIISYLKSEKKVCKEDNLWTKHGQNMDKIWTCTSQEKQTLSRHLFFPLPLWLLWFWYNLTMHPLSASPL